MNHCHAHTPQTPSRRRWTTYVAALAGACLALLPQGLYLRYHPTSHRRLRLLQSHRAAVGRAEQRSIMKEVLCCTLSNACVCCVSQW